MGAMRGVLWGVAQKYLRLFPLFFPILLLSMGFSHKAIAYNAYVSNTRYVEVVDTNTNEVTSKISTGELGGAHWLTITPDGKQIYALGDGAQTTGQLFVIDTATHQVGTVSPFGTAIDPETGLALRPTGSMTVTPDGKFLYVRKAYGTVGTTYFVIDTSTNTVASSFTIPFSAGGLTFNKDGTRAYTFDDADNKVLIINPTTQTVVSTFSLTWRLTNAEGQTEDYIFSGDLYTPLLSITPDGSQIYAYGRSILTSNQDYSDITDHTVAVAFDATTHTILGRVQYSGYISDTSYRSPPPHFVFTPDGRRGYLVGINKLLVLDTVSNTFVSEILTPYGAFGSQSLAITPDGKYGYATTDCFSTYVFDTTTNSFLTFTATAPCYQGGIVIGPDTPPQDPPTLIDPVAEFLDGPQITKVIEQDPNNPHQPFLADVSKGREVKGVATDGVAQVIIRIPAKAVGEQFALSIHSDQCNYPLDCIIDEYGFLFDPSQPPQNLFTNEPSPLQTPLITAVPTDQGPMAFAAYRAPVDFARSGNTDDEKEAQRSVFVSINSVPPGGTQQDLEIKLVRPPVFFIHGFNTDSSAWDDFYPLINKTSIYSINKPNYGYYLYDPDYSDPNNITYTPTTAIRIIDTVPSLIRIEDFLSQVRQSHLGFSFTTPYVAASILSGIKDFTGGKNPASLQVAAVGADIVAHSMGGLIARMWTTLPQYKSKGNYNQGPIHKLITLGTPHFGTPQATLSLLDETECSRTLATTLGNIAIESASLANPFTTITGAAGELQGDGIGANGLSPALQKINSSDVKIPMAMMAGDINAIAYKLDLAPVSKLLRNVCTNDPLAVRYTPTLFNNIFSPSIILNPITGSGGANNDGSVPLTSALMNSDILNVTDPVCWLCFNGYSHSIGISVFFRSTSSFTPGFPDGVNYLQDDSQHISDYVESLLNTPRAVFGVTPW
jgi:DNA-binding beta-propeller fold protein YncE/pimeloyl-ACP methyl ester carboxylesterase